MNSLYVSSHDTDSSVSVCIILSFVPYWKSSFLRFMAAQLHTAHLLCVCCVCLCQSWGCQPQWTWWAASRLTWWRPSPAATLDSSTWRHSSSSWSWSLPGRQVNQPTNHRSRRLNTRGSNVCYLFDLISRAPSEANEGYAIVSPSLKSWILKIHRRCFY